MNKHFLRERGLIIGCLEALVACVTVAVIAATTIDQGGLIVIGSSLIAIATFIVASLVA